MQHVIPGLRSHATGNQSPVSAELPCATRSGSGNLVRPPNPSLFLLCPIQNTAEGKKSAVQPRRERQWPSPEPSSKFPRRWFNLGVQEHIWALLHRIGFWGRAPYTIIRIRNPQNSIANYLEAPLLHRPWGSCKIGPGPGAPLGQKQTAQEPGMSLAILGESRAFMYLSIC